MDPKKHLRLRAEQYEFLRDLALSEREFVSVPDAINKLRAYNQDGDRAEAIFKRLQEEELLNPIPHAMGDCELSHNVRQDLLWLSNRQRARTPGQLNAQLDEIDAFARDLDQAIVERNIDVILPAAHQIQELLRDMGAFSRDNSDAIIADVMALKSSHDRRSLKQRLYEVKNLHERYVEPMRVIVDDRGRLSAVLVHLEATLRVGRDVFASDPTVPALLDRLSQRCAAFSRQAKKDFLSCSRELIPLYKKLYRSQRAAAATAGCLDLMAREGVKALDLATRLKISTFRSEGLFSTDGTRELLMRLQRTPATPSAPVRRGVRTSSKAAALITPGQLQEKLREQPQIEDLLGFLFDAFPDVGEHFVLMEYGHLLTDPRLVKGPFAPQPTVRVFRGLRYTYHPIGIGKHHGQ